MSDPVPALRLNLLGGFRAVRIDGGQEITVSSRKAKALLGFLSLSPNGPVLREKLAALLWEDRADAQARQSLRQCIAVLRRELQNGGPEILLTPGDGVALAKDVLWTDVDAFQAASRRADVESLRQAADLYLGEFLAGFNLDGEEFDAWVSHERRRLRDTAGDVLRRLARLEDDAGNGDRALAAAQRLIRLDPLSEDAQRLLIALLARHRGRASALRQYEDCIELLKRELDVDPDPETVALVEEIRAQADGAVNVPAASSTTDLAARAPELVEGRPGHPGRPFGRPVLLAGAAVAAALLVASGLVLTPAMLPKETERPPAITDGRQDPAPPKSGRLAIAVLPFGSYDGAADVLAAVLTDELTNDLSRFPGMDVVPLRTAAAFKGRIIDLKDAGRILGAGYLVEGSVRLSEGRMRLNVQLVDAKTGAQLWSDRFERSEAERPAVQNEILARLGRMLHVEATVAESERIRAAPPAAPSLDDLLMHAWAATINDTHGAARAQFEAILLQHPTSAGAREGAAWMTAAQVMNEPVADAATQLQYAERLIREAQQMRPNSARVHYIKGFVLRAQGRFEEALAALERSLAINHGYTMAHNMIGEVLLRMGRPEEALVSIETMMRLEPTGPNIGFAMASAGLAHLMLGNYDAGADHLRKAIDLKPNLGWPLALLAAAEVLRGNVEAGQAIALEFRRLPSRLPVDRITGGSQARPSFRERIQPVVEAMRIAGIDDTPAVSAR